MSVWLLDLYATSTWYIATDAVTSNGRAYMPGLGSPGSFTDALSFSLPAERSVQINLSPGIDPALDLDDIALGATATLWHWPTGASAPTVVLQGVVNEPTYGGADEPLTATLTELPWDDRARMPEPTARINASTWPNRDDGIDGEYYPTIIGAPGSTGVMGSPAYYVDTTNKFVLVAGHRVVASTVTIHSPTASASLSIIHGADGLGRTVAYVDATTLSLSGGEALYAVWDGGGGLAATGSTTVAMTGAGDVLEWLLRQSSLRVDYGRQRAWSARLNVYQIDTYMQSGPGGRTSPYEWISTHLLPLLPVSVRVGPGGLYIAVFDPSAPVEHAAHRLVNRLNCERISPVQTEGTNECVNDLSLGYAPRADEGDKPSATARVSADPNTLAAFSDAAESLICARSRGRFGPRSWEATTTAIEDASTAARILSAKATRSALPTQVVAYLLDSAEPPVEVGDPVSLTDSSLPPSWTNAVAYVWTIAPGDSGTEVTLRRWWAPWSAAR